MSSSAKRVQKLRKNQSDDEWKAELAKNAQRRRDKRAAEKSAKIKNPQQRDQKTPHESSLLSHGPDDSGFDTKNNLLKGSLFAQHDNRDSQFSCGDAANILNTLHVFHCSFFAQHDIRDSQFSCGDAANMMYTLHVFHYIDIQNVSYQLCFKRLRAYFSKKRDDVEKIAIRRRLLAEFNAGHNAKQAAENVCDIFGEGTLKHVTCQRWFQKFRKGNTALSDDSMGGLFFEWTDPTPTFENMFRQAELLEKNVMKAYNAKKKK